MKDDQAKPQGLAQLLTERKRASDNTVSDCSWEQDICEAGEGELEDPKHDGWHDKPEPKRN